VEEVARVKIAPHESTDAELCTAAARGRAEMRRDGARAVRYDPRSDELEIVLNSGVTVSMPRSAVPGLETASRENLAQVELSPLGTSIVFEKLDADYAVQGLLRKVLGLNEQQRAAGAVTSATKRAAAAANGRHGGRPRKVG
jgi:hypothetical protein